jgi:hypothetical protein
MDRLRKTLILLAVIAVPAAAHSTFAPPDELCFASGSATYRLVQKAYAPDFRIKIDNAAQRPDLRMQLVDRPEIADFVLADDYGTPPGNACKSPAPIKTIKVDSETRTPDVTVSLAPGDTLADYKIYVHSTRFSHRDVAAMLAALWKAQQHLQLAEHR